ncbi:MAG: hypothetical protein ACE5J2_05870 [Nitrososphaerales archaeon]
MGFEPIYTKFEEYCLKYKRTSTRTARMYRLYGQKYLQPLLDNPESLIAFTPKKRNWINCAMYAFCDYLNKLSLDTNSTNYIELANRIKRTIEAYKLNKDVMSNAKLYLLDTNIMNNVCRGISELDRDLGIAVKFLMYSGLREDEIIYVHQNYNKLQKKEYDGYTCIITDYHRYQKHSYFTIVPTQILHQFLHTNIDTNKLVLLRKYVKAKLGIDLRMLRKVHFTALSKVMDSTEVDVIQGRCNIIHARHYLLYELDKISDQYKQAFKFEEAVRL